METWQAGRMVSIVTDLLPLAEGWYGPEAACVCPSSPPSGGVGQQMGGDGSVR